jgi:hypothetical protein
MPLSYSTFSALGKKVNSKANTNIDVIMKEKTTRLPCFVNIHTESAASKLRKMITMGVTIAVETPIFVVKRSCVRTP